MTSSSSRGRRCVPAGQPGPELLHRAHDQRERGAELVADVGEERGLGPVELGELFGAPLLDLVGHRAVDQRRGLLGDQAEEGFVGSSSACPALAASTMTPVAWPPASPASGSTRAWAGGVGHPPAGSSPNRAATSVTRHRLPAAQHLADRPAARAVRERGRARPAAGRWRPGPVVSAGPAQVDGGERDILPGPFQGRHHELARFGDAAGAARLRAQVLQGGEPPLADDPLGGVADRGEHPAHHPVVVVQRAVGVRPVRLLPVAVPVHRQQQVLRPGRLPAAHHRVQHRADDVPDLGPHLSPGLPRAGCLVPSSGR